MLLVIDNYDSFTWNLVQILGELGEDPLVVRNDEASVDRLEAKSPDRIVISPGPCTPSEAGVSVEVVRRLGPRIPVLGVCLGHQAIGEAFGGRTIRAHRVMHGKTTPVRHTGEGIFEGLPNPLVAARYHSLVTDPDSLPRELVVVAWSEENDVEEDGAGRSEAGRAGAPSREIQAMRHRSLPVWGVQFHPESLFSTAGARLLENFLDL